MDIIPSLRKQFHINIYNTNLTESFVAHLNTILDGTNVNIRTSKLGLAFHFRVKHLNIIT